MLPIHTVHVHAVAVAIRNSSPISEEDSFGGGKKGLSVPAHTTRDRHGVRSRRTQTPTERKGSIPERSAGHRWHADECRYIHTRIYKHALLNALYGEGHRAPTEHDLVRPGDVDESAQGGRAEGLGQVRTLRCEERAITCRRWRRSTCASAGRPTALVEAGSKSLHPRLWQAAYIHIYTLQ